MAARRFQCTGQLLVARRSGLFRVAIERLALQPASDERSSAVTATRLEGPIRLSDFPIGRPGARTSAACGTGTLWRTHPGQCGSDSIDLAQKPETAASL